MYFVFWIALALLVAAFGSNRKIGFTTSLIVSLLLSPLVGFICVVLSKDNQTDQFEKEYLRRASEERRLKVKPTAEDYEQLEKAYKAKLIRPDEYRYRKDLLMKADEINS